mmetsp:Transcript_28711/g.72980  ORF Transcript_28711/g.72980 Transcript_28711/m.72980 type:complete len:244 (+) Transcript_28711:489-1220(+)
MHSTSPCCVPAGTCSSCCPLAVSTSMGAPSRASSASSRSSECRCAPSRVMPADSWIWKRSSRSPGSPPRLPASPSRGSRISVCSSTPAGTLTLTRRVTFVRPSPSHRPHCSAAITPLPPHAGHWPSVLTLTPLGCQMVRGTRPLPWHVPHGSCVAPCARPDPSHARQEERERMRTSFSTPVTASSRSSPITAATSPPRSPTRWPGQLRTSALMYCCRAVNLDPRALRPYLSYADLSSWSRSTS